MLYNRPMPTVRVDLPGQAYDIVIGPGLLARAGDEVAKLTRLRKVAIVTDTHVGPLHLPALTASLQAAGFEPVVVHLPAGEEHKTLDDLRPAIDTLLGARIERATPLLALGGGVIGDMTGFLASILLRGLPFVQIPTTLLSMVDASVGGKTGVNHATGKNLIGAFHQPKAVLIDVAVLRTLPERELRGGLAECIKHDLIRDAAGFERLERDITRALRLDVEYLAELVAHNVAIKARVVEKDPFEKGERAHLNFGHTFGHAIETVSDYSYSHGECVALGMCAAADLCVRLGMLADGDRRRIVRVIEAAGLPVRGLTLPARPLIDAMAFDKKVKDGKLRFVLLDRIGNAAIRDDVPRDLVAAAVESLRG
jgi:3-dehydroquinate synthase